VKPILGYLNSISNSCSITWLMANKLLDELMQLGHLLMQFYMYIEGANKLTMVMIIIETDLLSSFSNNS